jgi:hypothetical protein
VNKKTTLYLLIGVGIAIIAVLFFYISHSSQQSSSITATPSETALLSPLTARDIQSIDFQFMSSSGEPYILSLSRDGNDLWILSELPNSELDQGAVELVLAELLNLIPRRTISTLTPLDDLGLQDPSISITLGLENNTMTVLYIGDISPTGVTYYLQQDGNVPVTVSYEAVYSVLNTFYLQLLPVAEGNAPLQTPVSETPQP